MRSYRIEKKSELLIQIICGALQGWESTPTLGGF